MKLWLLDADVVIKFLELGIFDRLVKSHEVHVTPTVVEEVKYFYRDDEQVFVDFRREYIATGLVRESSATADEIKNILLRIPPLKRQVIHDGELESLAVLVREMDLILCTFDSVAIRSLPFLGVDERAISAERLLQVSGLTLSPAHKLDPRLSEDYFRNNLEQGRCEYVLAFGRK
ncbi:MAG: hypothetical protein AABZ02_10010 [Bacteroidota bacterium]